MHTEGRDNLFLQSSSEAGVYSMRIEEIVEDHGKITVILKKHRNLTRIHRKPMSLHFNRVMNAMHPPVYAFLRQTNSRLRSKFRMQQYSAVYLI